MDFQQSKAARPARTKAALRSLGFDPETALGDRWQFKIEDRFSRADREAAAALASKREPARYVALVHAAGDALATVEEQKAVVAPTMSALLAHFLRAAAKFSTGPDRVVFDRSNERIELYLRERPLVSLKRLQATAVSEQLLQAARGALLPIGTRSGSTYKVDRSHFQEHVKHIAGLSELGLDEEDPGLEQFPALDAWLGRGRVLCRQLGGDEGDLELVKKITAIALGVPSWDLQVESDEAVANACGPWYLAGNDPFADVEALYSSPVHATAALLEALQQNRFGTGDAPYVRSGGRDVIWVRNAPQRPENGLYGWWSLPGCEISRCDVAEPTAWESRAKLSLEAGTSEAIEDAFRAGQSRSERTAWHDEYHSERPVVESADWRFTLDRHGKSKYLYARLLDTTGRAIFGAEVAARSGRLEYAPELGAHVLRERKFGEIVAIMHGLDAQAVRVLQQALRGGASSCPSTELAGLDEHDVKEVLAFMDRVQRTQM